MRLPSSLPGAMAKRQRELKRELDIICEVPILAGLSDDGLIKATQPVT